MIRIRCCKDCVPPKRHVGCRDRCQEYQDEKKKMEQDKEAYRKTINPLILKGSFLGDSCHKRR